MPEGLNFDGRVAVVTGAGRGMGRSHAHLLGALGAQVVVNDLAVEDTAPEDQLASTVAAEIEAAGGVAAPRLDDISTESGAAELIAETLRLFGRIDVVVNNAGIIRLSPFHELTATAFDATMKINAYGPFFVTRAAWPHFMEQRYGRVVMVCSSAALFGLANRADYAASKGAMIGLTRDLAAEGDALGIRVNALLPTAVTRMSSPGPRSRVAARLGMSDKDEDLPALMDRSAALVSPVVAWLAHEECAVTGEILEAGGGHVGRVFLGATVGIDDPELTVDKVRRRFAEIEATEGYAHRPTINPM